MALHDLPAAIEAEANAKVARLQDGRHREAGAILADAERQARELEAAAVEAAEHEERQAVPAAGLRDAHEAAYQQIAAETGARLAKVRERGDYPAILAALLAEARAALAAATVGRIDPADEPLTRSLLPGDIPGPRRRRAIPGAGAGATVPSSPCRLLDVACGSGLAIELAGLRGAVCTGIDRRRHCCGGVRCAA